MPMSASMSVQTLRAGQGRLSHGPLMPRLWQAMRGEWQRRQDRLIAVAVQGLDHPGVCEDYRSACQRRFPLPR